MSGEDTENRGRPRRGWLVGLGRGIRHKAVRLFRIRAANEAVARGFALGMIVNFLPTFGAGVLISGFLARAMGGNTVAGFIGGASLTWAWPFLFYLNIRVGSWLLHRRAAITDPEQLSDGALGRAVWGQAFSVGAFVNCLVIGGAVYLLLRVLYGQLRRPVLKLLRRSSGRRRNGGPGVPVRRAGG